MVRKTKTTYESPISKVFEIRMEGIMTPASETPDSANSGYDSNSDLGEI
jgi:hypothetical protein